MSQLQRDKVALQHSQTDVMAPFITLCRCTFVELWLIDQLTQFVFIRRQQRESVGIRNNGTQPLSITALISYRLFKPDTALSSDELLHCLRPKLKSLLTQRNTSRFHFINNN
ncbi:uncharacterized protein V6R79_018028 [Siganus canaliculatus]